MDKRKKLLKKFSYVFNFVHTLLGMALIILLILAFQNPNNRYVVLAAFITAGLMNVANGIRIIKDPKKKNMGMSYIMFGIILMFLGYGVLIFLK